MAISLAFNADKDTANKTAGDPYVGSLWTPVAGHYYAVGIGGGAATGNAPPPSAVAFTGAGLIPVYVQDIPYKVSGSSRTGLTLYQLVPKGGTTAGTLQITWGVDMIGYTCIVIDLDTYEIVITNVVEASAAPATPSGTVTCNLGTPISAIASRPAYVLSANDAVGYTVETNWTELDEAAITAPALSIMGAFRGGAWDASCVATHASGSSLSAVGMIAFELTAARRRGSFFE